MSHLNYSNGELEKLENKYANYDIYKVDIGFLDDDSGFFYKNNDGEIKTIISKYPPEENKFIKNKIKEFEKNNNFKDSKTKIVNFYTNKLLSTGKIPIHIFKSGKPNGNIHIKQNRESIFRLLLDVSGENPYLDFSKNYKYVNNPKLTKTRGKKHIIKGGTKRRLRSQNGLFAFQKEVSLKFFEILLMIKLFHWNTHTYSVHKATDELYSKFNEHMDKFIEVLLGKTGSRIELYNTKSISLLNLHNNEQLKHKINQFKSYLVSFDTNKALSTMSNTDLLNIRDEILGDMNQFLYLLTFK